MTKPVRCRVGLKFGDNLLTRCMLKIGHNGPHTGKGLQKHPYQRIHWFKGDGREFLTDADHEFAWGERKSKEHTDV